MVQSCCVEGCKSEWSPVSDISLFGFPLNNQHLLQKWKEEIPTKCKITKNTRICNMHFDGDALEERFGKRMLKKSAVPTLFPAKELAKYKNAVKNTVKTKVLIVLTPIPEKKPVQDPLRTNFNNINENSNTENSLDKIEISEITNELNDTARNVSTPVEDLQDPLYVDFYNENSCSINTINKLEIAEIDNVVNDVARDILSPKREIIEMQDPLRINFDNDNENANIENPLLENSNINNSTNNISTNIFQPIREKMEIQDPLYFDENDNTTDSLFRKINISTINNSIENTLKNVFVEKMDINFGNENNINNENPIRKVETKEASTQVDPNHIPYSERERAMRRKIKSLEARLKRRDEKINKISQLINELKKSGNMTEELEEVLIKRFEGFNLELFINELKNSKTSKKEYTHKMKEFASTLYFYSPKGYNYVRSKLNLPNEATLRKWIGQCSCKVDFLSGALIFSENEILKSDITEDVTL